MKKTRTPDVKLNFAGRRIAELRKSMGMSQNWLAGQLQLQGVNLHKNAVSKAEKGERFISDIELMAFAKALNVTVEDLLPDVPMDGGW